MERSWTALDRSERNSNRVVSHLEGQKAPKTEPGRVQNGVQNRIRIENGEITKKHNTSHTKTYLLGSRVSKIGPQTGPKLVPNRIFDAEALRKPLESLLERSWRPQEPKKRSWERLLAGLGPKREGKMGPQAISCTLIFEVPNWDPKLDPNLMAFQMEV